MKSFYFLVLSLLIYSNSFGRIVEGFVYDNTEKLPLPVFQVLLLGGKEAEYTYTDEQGHFEFYISHNDTVHIRFQNIGFVTMDIVDIPKTEKASIGKVYMHLDSYLRTRVYDKKKGIWTQKVQKVEPSGTVIYEPRVNPKEILLICPNDKKLDINLTKLFSEVAENKAVSLKYKNDFGLKREEFYYITYTDFIKKCN